VAEKLCNTLLEETVDKVLGDDFQRVVIGITSPLAAKLIEEDFVEGNGIEIVIQAQQRFNRSYDIAESLCSLFSMAVSHYNIKPDAVGDCRAITRRLRELRQRGLHEAVLRILIDFCGDQGPTDCSSAEAAYEALQALFYIMTCHDGANMVEIFEECVDFEKVIVKTMKKYRGLTHGRVCSAACTVICNICANDERWRERFGNEGACECVYNALGDYDAAVRRSPLDACEGIVSGSQLDAFESLVWGEREHIPCVANRDRFASYGIEATLRSIAASKGIKEHCERADELLSREW
jgi:hypothetical protein